LWELMLRDMPNRLSRKTRFAATTTTRAPISLELAGNGTLRKLRDYFRFARYSGVTVTLLRSLPDIPVPLWMPVESRRPD